MYVNPYNQQNNLDRINYQIAELEKMKQQMQQPISQPITQNFQLAPTNHDVIKYANSMEDVEKSVVVGDTPFFSKDMSVVWIKNTKGEIKAYELTEIIPKDNKDLMIESLQAQINEMKGMIRNAKSNDEYVDESIESSQSSDVSISNTSSKRKK